MRSKYVVGTMVLTQIAGPNTIVHPGTVMVHATNAPITNPTMMRAGWFVRLTSTAHGMGRWCVDIDGNGRIGNGSWISKGCFGVRGQCQGTNGKINLGENGIEVAPFGQESDGHSRICCTTFP